MTVTPDPTSSNTPTPTFTPTMTETPTVTPTNDPYFYYETVSYNCGVSGEGCGEGSTGTPVLRFTSVPSDSWYSNGITAYLIGSQTSGPTYNVDADLLSGNSTCTAACGF
jgi:hypothetical protein